jgi:hypothetical protein
VTDGDKAQIVAVLCSLALAENLGDVRDAEEGLWKLLDASKLPFGHPAWDADEAWPVTQARIATAGFSLPEHLRG